MPQNELGQLITFAVEISADETFSAYIWLRAKRGDTPRKIAARRGHPEEGKTIAKLNKLRSEWVKIKPGKRIRIPGTLKQGDSFNVLPQDMARPVVADGYATYQTVNRPGRIGVNQFMGYNPLQLTVPIQFERANGHYGDDIETDIAKLERMAGRGSFKGAASGPPSVIRISVTDAYGKIVPLVAPNYQWSPQNPSAPLWRIGGSSGAGIDWDASPTSNGVGKRIRQLATVTLTQYTPIVLAERSATKRSKGRNTKRKTT